MRVTSIVWAHPEHRVASGGRFGSRSHIDIRKLLELLGGWLVGVARIRDGSVGMDWWLLLVLGFLWGASTALALHTLTQLTVEDHWSVFVFFNLVVLHLHLNKCLRGWWLKLEASWQELLLHAGFLGIFEGAQLHPQLLMLRARCQVRHMTELLLLLY